MLTYTHAQRKFQAFQNVNVLCLHAYIHQKRRESEGTWQNPDTPAMDSKLKALARKLSSVLGSVCSFGGGPGTVGIARTPKSW